MPSEIRQPTAKFHNIEGAGFVIVLGGDWLAGSSRPSADELIRSLATDQPARVGFDTSRLGQWDSLLLTFLVKLKDYCEQQGIAMDFAGLPAGVRGLMDLAYAVPERQDARRSAGSNGFLAMVGNAAISLWDDAIALTAFIGETSVTFLKLVLGRARFRWVDLWLLIQHCGADALPIVSLISVLVGMILAFVGSVQLSKFGAQVYIADLVGLGMAREMGALMTAIIMAGRTGAAFAAQLGSMQVNDEIDALKTMGFSEMEFLVLPRLLALILMMPLLCVYADVMGIAGGALASISLFDISFLEYFHHVHARLRPQDLLVGIGKSAVFGILVAISGCMRGMQCGRSSSGVGFAATSAVVTGIVMIVVADAVMTLIVTTLHW